MTQSLTKLVTFDEFTAWRPESGSYELHDGVIVEMAQPIGDHEDVTMFLAQQLTAENIRLSQSYYIPKTVLVKHQASESAYSPDILLLNRPNLVNEPLWKKQSTVIYGASIPLVVEVVSSNWQDDYYMKLGRYEEIGISEYWIVDYLGLAAKKFTGNPKQPTLSIYQLVDEEYQVSQFRNNDRIISPTFPDFNFTAKQIFNAGQ
jgi:Uma2 family endonuclease